MIPTMINGRLFCSAIFPKDKKSFRVSLWNEFNPFVLLKLWLLCDGLDLRVMRICEIARRKQAKEADEVIEFKQGNMLDLSQAEVRFGDLLLRFYLLYGWWSWGLVIIFKASLRLFEWGRSIHLWRALQPIRQILFFLVILTMKMQKNLRLGYLCWWGTHSVVHELTFFLQDEDGRFTRYDEVHEARTYEVLTTIFSWNKQAF